MYSYCTVHHMYCIPCVFKGILHSPKKYSQIFFTDPHAFSNVWLPFFRSTQTTMGVRKNYWSFLSEKWSGKKMDGTYCASLTTHLHRTSHHNVVLYNALMCMSVGQEWLFLFKVSNISIFLTRTYCFTSEEIDWGHIDYCFVHFVWFLKCQIWGSNTLALYSLTEMINLCVHLKKLSLIHLGW